MQAWQISISNNFAIHIQINPQILAITSSKGERNGQWKRVVLAEIIARILSPRYGIGEVPCILRHSRNSENIYSRNHLVILLMIIILYCVLINEWVLYHSLYKIHSSYLWTGNSLYSIIFMIITEMGHLISKDSVLQWRNRTVFSGHKIKILLIYNYHCISDNNSLWYQCLCLIPCTIMFI